MPSGPGAITDEEIAELIPHVPPGVTSVLLTSHLEVAKIVAQHRQCKPHAIQVCDYLSARQWGELRRALPGTQLLGVIHMAQESAIQEAEALEPLVDALLLDSGNPKLSVKVLGGTGQTHPWAWSRKIVQNSKKPVFLAGGLRAGNIAQAVSEVEPFGVDLCTGVRTEGALDSVKLGEFVQALQEAKS